MASERWVRRVVFFGFGLSGLAALIYEVVWFRALSLVLGSTTYALSTMLATFMAGLSLGAFLGGSMADRWKEPVLLYVYLEGLIGILALLVLPAVNLIPPFYAMLFYTFQFSFEAFSASQFLICSVVMLPPAVLMGATFPVVCRICFKGEGIGRETGGVYAVNTVGAIGGSILAGFILVPYLGLKGANTAGASINILVAIACAATAKGRAKALPYLLTFFLILLSLVYMVPGVRAYPFNFYIGGRYGSYESFLSEFGFTEKVYEVDSAHGNLKVLKGVTGSVSLINNGKIESNDSIDLLNLATLAYLPASANPRARNFLNIGLGTGGTIHYASSISGLRDIYSVEINPSVMEASRLFFYPEIFKDPRVRFVTADARNYLSMVNRGYDIISSEPSYPVDQGFSHLYSREFFELVKDRLNEGGVFCQWVPRYIFRGDDFKMIVKTFQMVFPDVTVWRAKSGDFLLLGGKGTVFDTGSIMKGVTSRFEGSGFTSSDFALVSDQEDVETRLKDYKGPINTDNHPIVEFIGARRMFEVTRRQ